MNICKINRIFLFLVLQNLERELVPVEEKMNRMNYLADSVRSSYPDERGYVNKRQKEIQDMWDNMKKKADDRRNRLDDSGEHQLFSNNAKDLVRIYIYCIQWNLTYPDTSVPRLIVRTESLSVEEWGLVPKQVSG